jgi:hypothetical protein
MTRGDLPIIGWPSSIRATTSMYNLTGSDVAVAQRSRIMLKGV